jgi:hypothetical protein
MVNDRLVFLLEVWMMEQAEDHRRDARSGVCALRTSRLFPADFGLRRRLIPGEDVRCDIFLDKCSHFHPGDEHMILPTQTPCMADANNSVEGPSEGCYALGFALEIDECKSAG